MLGYLHGNNNRLRISARLLVPGKVFSTPTCVLVFYWLAVKLILAAFSLDEPTVTSLLAYNGAHFMQINMATGQFREDLWKKAFLPVQEQFHIEQLIPEQKQCIHACLEKGNVFVNLPRGFGKPLVFQCLPIVADIIHILERCSSVLMVISPLKSLMDDQIKYLESVGIPAIAIGNEDDPEIIQQVIEGYYILVYCSPEAVLSTATWRGILSSSIFKEELIGVAIDEAHCITQWCVSYYFLLWFRFFLKSQCDHVLIYFVKQI